MACCTAAGGIDIEVAFAGAAVFHVFAVMTSMTLLDIPYKDTLIFSLVGHNNISRKSCSR